LLDGKSRDLRLVHNLTIRDHLRYLGRVWVWNVWIHSTTRMRTAVPPSDSATTNMAPHLVLVTKLIPMDAGLGLGRQDEGHGKMIDMRAVVIDGLADEDI